MVKVNVISGFLGAGKTTLIKKLRMHLLHACRRFPESDR